MRWFRMYSDVVANPKVQQLPPFLFKFWVNCLAMAADNEGYLPSIKDICFKLRPLSGARCAQWITQLNDCGLLDADANTFRPHNWEARQYQSDHATERIKKHRVKQQKSAPEAVAPVAPPPEPIKVEPIIRMPQRVAPKPPVHFAESEWIDRRWNMHPIPGVKILAEQYAAARLGEPRGFTMQQFDAAHDEWLAHWRDNPRDCPPNLEKFIVDEWWRKHPPVKNPTNGHVTKMGRRAAVEAEAIRICTEEEGLNAKQARSDKAANAVAHDRKLSGVRGGFEALCHRADRSLWWRSGGGGANYRRAA